MKPYLSIIIPTYNEVERIEWSLVRLYSSLLDKYLRPYEVIVVDNGSTDRTELMIEGLLDKYPHLRSIDLLQKGKGLAVRTGMLEAHGDWRVMCDCDWSMGSARIPDLLENADVCITTRQGPHARRIGEPFTRHVTGRVFNILVRRITGLPFQDTQCGYKAFSERAAVDLFSRCHVDGLAFDVEVLYIAMLRMYTISEVPITWTHNHNSRVSPMRDAVNMLRDVITLKRMVDRSTVQPLERFA